MPLSLVRFLPKFTTHFFLAFGFGLGVKSTDDPRKSCFSDLTLFFSVSVMVNLVLIDSALSDCRSPKCVHYVSKTQEVFFVTDLDVYLSTF